MRRARCFPLLLLSNLCLFAATVPFVGCAADGQAGPVKAPPPGTVDLRIPEEAAQHLALFGSPGFSTLAPRGWHCFELYGSSGASLWIAPQRLSARSLIPAGRTFDGPVIELSGITGQTSGRDIVAEVIAQVFPAHLDFVKEVVAMFDYPRPRLRYGPWPTDVLTRRGSEFVEYTTPANTDGLGTNWRVIKGTRPIRGFAQLFLPDHDLVQLRVRLPEALDHLSSIIVKQTAADANARPPANRRRKTPDRRQ